MLPEVNCQQPMAQAQWVAQPRCCASAAPQQQVCRVQAYAILMRPPSPSMLLAWYIWCSYALVLHYHRFPADIKQREGFWHTGKPPPMIGLIIKNWLDVAAAVVASPESSAPLPKRPTSLHLRWRCREP